MSVIDRPGFGQNESGESGATSWTPVPMSSEHEREMLERSIYGLKQAAPRMSADHVVSTGQKLGLVVAGLLVVAGAVFDPILTMQIAIGLATVVYSAAVIYRVVLVKAGLAGTDLVRVTDEEARAIADADLPVYTVLVPAYREPEVIATVIESMAAIDYPTDKLDVRLLLEEDDVETIRVARRTVEGSPVRIVLVPAAEPRTKPKACNYGLQSARGEFVTIYDAEDKPEPLQLRRAVVALGRLGAGYACVQARLGYFNSRQNLITRFFTVEYGNWFRFLLPGLVSVGAPIPLGGTSNHFRAGLLRSIGAWDAYNVTEDADLGIRLARLGYKVGVLDSVTDEEANSDFVNWIKQRSRWYKGYLQTWLVHMREPRTVHRELGWRGALGLHLFVLGTPLTALINPIFWALAVLWAVQQPAWVAELFPAQTYYLALACFVFGNAAVIYMGMLTISELKRPDLLMAALLVPLYWLMMSVAAAKATYQLIVNPSYWEKTSHGLAANADTTRPADEPAELVGALS